MEPGRQPGPRFYDHSSLPNRIRAHSHVIALLFLVSPNSVIRRDFIRIPTIYAGSCAVTRTRLDTQHPLGNTALDAPAPIQIHGNLCSPGPASNTYTSTAEAKTHRHQTAGIPAKQGSTRGDQVFLFHSGAKPVISIKITAPKDKGTCFHNTPCTIVETCAAKSFATTTTARMQVPHGVVTSSLTS